MSEQFGQLHGIPFEKMPKPMVVKSPVSNWQTFMVTLEILVNVGYSQFPTTFYALKSTDIDVILGTSWLKQYGAVLDCAKRSITLTHPTRGVMTYWIDASLAPSACYHPSPELQLFLSQGDYPPEIHELPVVSDFPDVFPKELPGMPPD